MRSLERWRGRWKRQIEGMRTKAHRRVDEDCDELLALLKLEKRVEGKKEANNVTR